MTVAPAAEARFAALRHRNFTLLWSGLLGLSFAIPMIVFPLLGGVVADRVNRIRLLYITQTGQMLVAIVQAVLTWLNGSRATWAFDCKPKANWWR